MKYVFYDATIYSGLPLYTNEIVGYVKNAVGSMMEAEYMKQFVENLKGMVQQVNEKKKAKMSVEYSVTEHAYLKRKFGHITIYKNQEKDKVVAFLYFVAVNRMWAEDENSKLRTFTFEEWENLKYRIELRKMKKGGQS